MRRMNTLWCPYVIGNGIALLLNNFFLQIGVYTNNPVYIKEIQEISNIYAGGHSILSYTELLKQVCKVLLFMRDTELTGPSWFCRNLFFVTIFFAVMDYALLKLKLNRIVGHSVISALFLIIGFIGSKNYTYIENQFVRLIFKNVVTILMAYVLFLFGTYLRQREILKKMNPYVALAGGFSVLIICENTGTVGMGEEYTSILFYITASVSGWYAVWGTAKIIMCKSNLLTKLFSYVGQHTLPILFLHLTVFKIVNYVQVCVYKKPKYLIAAYPYLYDNIFWQIIYTLSGIILPLGINVLYKRISNTLKDKA